MVDRDAGRVRVDATIAASVAPTAREVTAPLDSVASPTAGEVARFAFRNSRRDITIVVATAIAVGLLGLLTPLITQYVFATLVPEQESSLLVIAGVGLFLSAVLVGVFTAVQGFAVSRSTLRASQRLQNALWDRVMALPVPFFRREGSGALASRVLSVQSLEQVVTTTTVTTLLSSIFTLVNFALLFYYDALLALLSLVLIVVVVAGTAWFGRQIVAATRPLIDQNRSNSSQINDILRALSKIRAARAERRFFALHAENIRRSIVLQDRQQQIGNRLSVFYASLTIFFTSSLYVVIAGLGWDDATGRADIAPATYVAFVTALNAILGATVALSGLIQPLAIAGPTIAAMGPIIETRPQRTEQRRDPGVLRGGVELRHVSFQYEPGGAPVLSDVSFRVEPGEFVALVGPSGSGKSTVLRLVLGFERAEEGAILYDDQAANDVDLDAVRRQFGVVMQNGRLVGGSILENLVGALPLGPDDAWDALTAAALDEEVRAMPMGLHTRIDAAGSTFSGGQLQRLLIAKALISKPRLLLLDEATSALDDVTQDAVARSIQRLDLTRIVVAHRLSTIRGADRIIVLDHGKVVENGGFEELVAAGGLFSQLVRRQTA
jgi:NHLM bacteriocin system ABC transporter ATP-binding protein